MRTTHDAEMLTVDAGTPRSIRAQMDTDFCLLRLRKARCLVTLMSVQQPDQNVMCTVILIKLPPFHTHSVC